jgi:pimeloyl-ACP methyl ester carboxylesterase
MRDWSLGSHAEDVGKAMAVARRVRTLTGSGNGKMNLLGWSRGAQVAYAYMNAETRASASERHVRGFIPVDMVFKFGPEAEAERQAACVRAQAGEAILAQGRYEGNLGGPGAGLAILAVGQGALNSPDAPAQPPLPPLPYAQLGVALGAATYSFIADPANGIEAPVPFYHFTAGKFANGSLVGLHYVLAPQFFDFLAAANPYQSLREQVEGDALQCGTTRLPYDDHLKDVKVPVLYVGAAGGFGTYGEYSTSLLGSKDVTFLRAQRDLDRAAEYGHADLWLASDAESKVWKPIYEWMKKH